MDKIRNLRKIRNLATGQQMADRVDIERGPLTTTLAEGEPGKMSEEQSSTRAQVLVEVSKANEHRVMNFSGASGNAVGTPDTSQLHISS